MIVSRVFALFYYLLWKAKLDLSALSEGFDSWCINVSFSTGSIASCGVMKTSSCIISFGRTVITLQTSPVIHAPRASSVQVEDSIIGSCAST